MASVVLCVFCRVKDHHNLLHYLLLLKETCVRQVVLDKWLPLNQSSFFDEDEKKTRRVSHGT